MPQRSRSLAYAVGWTPPLEASFSGLRGTSCDVAPIGHPDALLETSSAPLYDTTTKIAPVSHTRTNLDPFRNDLGAVTERTAGAEAVRPGHRSFGGWADHFDARPVRTDPGTG